MLGQVLRDLYSIVDAFLESCRDSEEFVEFVVLFYLFALIFER